MKRALGIVLLLLAIAVAVPVAIVAGFWVDASSQISKADQDGILLAAADMTELNAAEGTIVAAMFSDTWDVQGTPCRTFMRSWNTLVTGSEDLSGMPVSQRLSLLLLKRESAEQSFQDGIRQLFIACELERRYVDTEMLRIWLSNADFGAELRGIEGAAQMIFGKRAGDLNKEESVQLAALLYAPGLQHDHRRWNERTRALAQRISSEAK